MSTLLTTYATLTGTAIGISFACDSALTAASRKIIFDWLFKDINCRRFRNWPSKALIVFRTLFGRHHFSKKCAVSSILFTIIFVTTFYFIAFLMNEGVLDEFLDTFILKSDVQDDYIVLTVIIFFFVTLLTAAIPDFLSILETRCMLRLAHEKKNKILVTMSIMIFDAIITMIIFIFVTYLLLTFSLFIKISYSMYFYEGVISIDILRNIPRIIEFSLASYSNIQLSQIERIISYEVWLTEFAPEKLRYISSGEEKSMDIWLSRDRFSMISPLFYSTFLTSIWLWVFILASAISRTSQIYRKYLQKMPNISAFLEHKPITIACLLPILAALPFVLILELLI